MRRTIYSTWWLLALAGIATPAAKDSCVECHAVLGGNLAAPAAAMADDIHHHNGFSCVDCHGGDPAAADPQLAMSPARGFIGKPTRFAIPRLCARCHSDASLMHKYAPQQRIDQYAQYVTSIHGQRIAAGDAAAAVCTDCHGVHGIRAVKDPLAPVYPLRLPETCARCHSDPRYMAQYKIPTDQFADYRKSVHWVALEKRGDLSAPTCASCHGNHGATPPGLTTVAAVCGTCHVIMEDLYNKSPHQPVFASAGLAGCVVCHSNHAVLTPSDAMLAGPEAVCSQCHPAGTSSADAAAQMSGLIQKLTDALSRADAILNRATSAGMEVSDAVLRQNDAREALVKARVAVHAFQVAAVAQPVSDGLKIAAETYQAGTQAMNELRRRRIGLAFSLVAILVTLIGLWLAIRRLEKVARSTEPRPGAPRVGSG